MQWMIVIHFSTFSTAPNSSDELNSTESEVEGEVDSTFRPTHNPEADDAPTGQATFHLLDTLDKASIYLRRAMVNAVSF